MMRWMLPFLMVWSCIAGQSLVLDKPSGGVNFVSITDPAYPVTSEWRAEFHLHGINRTGLSDILSLRGIGLILLLQADHLQVTDERNTYPDACRLPYTPSRNTLYRIQRTATQLVCEQWEVGTDNYFSQSRDRTGNGTENSGGYVGTTATHLYQASIGFLRIHNTTLPLRSRPPVTADTQNVIRAWRFDGNGTAEAGGNNIPTGTFSFTNTPIGPGVMAVPWQLSRKPWMQVAPPLRAGHASADLISNSYSLSDTNPDVTCFWQQVSGPSKLVWTNRNACNPTVSGAVFGQYTLRLRATDMDGRVNTADYTVGAVAWDDNGVVIYPHEKLKKLIGPTLVWGQNPWEIADHRHWELAAYNWAAYDLHGGPWIGDHIETVFNGIPRLGTVTRDAPGNVGSATVLGTGTNFLEVFCGGRAGPAVPDSSLHVTLSLAYGERNNYDHFMVRPVVSCQSDTQLTIGTGGEGYIPAPGLPWRTVGLQRYVRSGVTGTVYINPAVNPRKVYGVGTNLQTILCGGGSSPAAAGMGGIYIFGASYTDLRGVASCESETEITLATDFPQTAIASPGVNWAGRNSKVGDSFLRFGSPVSRPNFYEVGIGLYQLWMRTGLNMPRDAWRWLAARSWNTTQGEPRYSTWFTAVLLHEFDDVELPSPQKDRDHFWAGLQFTKYHPTVFPGQGGLLWDVRESAYALIMHALAAEFAPTEGLRSWARGKMQDFWNNTVTAQLPEGRFLTNLSQGSELARSFVLNQGSTLATLNTGNIPANHCGDTSTFYSAGAITAITNGSTAITGTGVDWTTQVNKEILIRGTRNGQPWSQRNRLVVAPTATTGTLRFPWWGDNNSAIAYRLGAAVPMAAMPVSATNVASSMAIVDEDEWYWCTVTSATTMQLDKPYLGDTSGGNIYRRLIPNKFGNATSVFMNSIMGTALFLAANVDGLDSTLATNFREMARKTMNHMRSMSEPYGYGILPYFESVVPMCGGYTGPRPNWCTNGGGNFYLPQQKSYAVENIWPMVREYELYGETWRRDVLDQWYSNLFPDTQGFSAPFSPVEKALPDTIGEYIFGGGTNRAKFFGQTYGIGGGQTWPAQRVGGLTPRIDRLSLVPFSLDDIPGATQFRLIVYFPSGGVERKVCAESPCSINLDARQGDHWILKQYLNAQGDVVAESSRELLRLQ